MAALVSTSEVLIARPPLEMPGGERLRSHALRAIRSVDALHVTLRKSVKTTMEDLGGDTIK